LLELTEDELALLEVSGVRHREVVPGEAEPDATVPRARRGRKAGRRPRGSEVESDVALLVNPPSLEVPVERAQEDSDGPVESLGLSNPGSGSSDVGDGCEELDRVLPGDEVQGPRLRFRAYLASGGPAVSADADGECTLRIQTPPSEQRAVIEMMHMRNRIFTVEIYA